MRRGVVDHPGVDRSTDWRAGKAVRDQRTVHGEDKVSARNGVFDSARLAPGQTADERALLALKVNGVEVLSLDHGYPARIIGPGIPGVHCTKWVSAMTFDRA